MKAYRLIEWRDICISYCYSLVDISTTAVRVSSTVHLNESTIASPANGKRTLRPSSPTSIHVLKIAEQVN